MDAGPYAVLVQLAEREHAMVTDGRVEELAALAAERAALIAALPAQAPASARPHLERAAGLQLATSAALTTALARTRRELGSLQDSGRAARAYASIA